MEHFTPASSQRKTRVSPRTATRSSSAPLLIPYRLPFCEGNLISHIFRKNEICCEADWEGYFSYSGVEVPDSYRGPRPTFPLTLCGVLKLVEAFKHKQVGPGGQTPRLLFRSSQLLCSGSQQQLHGRFVLQLLGETWRFLRNLPNINQVSACQNKEITICGTQLQVLENSLSLFLWNLLGFFCNAAKEDEVSIHGTLSEEPVLNRS